MSKEIIILTRKQKKELKPLFQKVKESAANGERGAIVAQVLENCMACEFINHKLAVKIRAVYEEEQKNGGKR